LLFAITLVSAINPNLSIFVAISTRLERTVSAVSVNEAPYVFEKVPVNVSLAAFVVILWITEWYVAPFCFKLSKAKHSAFKSKTQTFER